MQVEEQLYRINCYFLERESQFFRDMFSLPQGDSAAHTGTMEGKDDDHPIKLAGTTVVEFDSLLRFFHFGMHSDFQPTPDEWMAILSISTRLMFDKVRERAVTEITARVKTMDPFKLIAGAKKYDVDQWLMPAYRKIVIRADLITDAEALSIPFATAMMLTRSREQFGRQTGLNSNYHYGSRSNNSDYYGRVYNDNFNINDSHPVADSIINAQVQMMDTGGGQG
ncbi:hypothetical protein BC834DRAFT_968992 [Gloeopeniophorella convolvens]|nr:hypothetical protein BC834DRAFT_968992 [Gloeopeniophorella convolvens]